MKDSRALWRKAVVPACLAACLMGCAHSRSGIYEPPPPKMLGVEVDEWMMVQEQNAEAAKFIVYNHEFEASEWKDGTNRGGWRLNSYGEDHLKQIAVNLVRGDLYPVIVERTHSSVKAGTEYEYPVHFNEELDLRRRQVVVASLQALGVSDAEERVVVAPSFAEGLTASEASRAYQRSLNPSRGLGGFGGFGQGIGAGFGNGFGF